MMLPNQLILNFLTGRIHLLILKNRLTMNECIGEFRFSKNNIYSLVDALRIPDEVRCPNRKSIDAVEALCILLKRNSYPCRFSDLIPTFGRSVAEPCNIASVVNNHIFETHGHLLISLNQPWAFYTPITRVC